MIKKIMRDNKVPSLPELIDSAHGGRAFNWSRAR